MSAAWTPAYRRVVRRRAWLATFTLGAIFVTLLWNTMAGSLPGGAGRAGGVATAAGASPVRR